MIEIEAWNHRRGPGDLSAMGTSGQADSVRGGRIRELIPIRDHDGGAGWLHAERERRSPMMQYAMFAATRRGSAFVVTAACPEWEHASRRC